MSNVIQFLEKLGRDAAIGEGSAESYASAVSKLEIDDALRQVLLSKDSVALNKLLGARHNVMMILVPAEDEPAENDGPGRDDGEEEIRAIASGN